MPSPTLVQASSSSNTLGNGVTQYKHRLSNPTKAGNLLVVCINSGGNAVTPSSITDEQSNTYNLAATKTDLSQTLAIYYVFNCKAGARVITINYAAATSFCGNLVLEYANVQSSSDPLNGSNSNSGSGTALTAGSFTPADNSANGGNLVLGFAIQDTSIAKITSWTAGTSAAFKLEVHIDTDEGNACNLQPETPCELFK